MRSKTLALVRQEFYSRIMTHFAVRGPMHEATIMDDTDPDELPYFGAFPPLDSPDMSGHEDVLDEIV